VFEKLKIVLTKALVLAYYNLLAKTMIETNALDRVCARVLLQKGLDRHFYLIGYYLKSINCYKLNYKIYNKKMLVVI
jgi:hypothetical protein